MRMIGHLGARFDSKALHPPAAVLDASLWRLPAGVSQDIWLTMLEWCRGSGEQKTRPASSVQRASLHGGSETKRFALAEALCQHLDGSVRLAACRGVIGRLGLRLIVKLGDALGGLGDTHPWDCGYATPGTAGLQALAQFRPRRDTLIVMHALLRTDVDRRLEVLNANLVGFERNVRVLVLPEEAHSGAGPLTFDAGGQGAGGVT